MGWSWGFGDYTSGDDGRRQSWYLEKGAFLPFFSFFFFFFFWVSFPRDEFSFEVNDGGLFTIFVASWLAFDGISFCLFKGVGGRLNFFFFCL